MIIIQSLPDRDVPCINSYPLSISVVVEPVERDGRPDGVDLP